MAISTYSELKTAIANFLYGRSDLTSRIPEFVSLCEDRIAREIRVRAMETQARIVWQADVDGGTVGGTANAITLSAQSGTPSLGESYTFTAASTNTSTTTINSINVKVSYAGTVAALSGGEIVSGASYRIYYDGTQWIIAPLGGALLPTDFLEFRSFALNDASYRRLEFFAPSAFWSQDAVLLTDDLTQEQSGQPRIFTIEGDWIILGPAPGQTYRATINYYRRFPAFSSDSDTNWLLSSARAIYLYGTLLEAANFTGDDADSLKYAALYEDAKDAVLMADKMARFPSGMAVARKIGATP